VIKLFYKPFGLFLGVFGGVLAGALFKQLWKVATDDDDTPDATDEEREWKEILGAAAIQGAIFGVVKAVLHRGGATTVRKLTGTWPG